MRTIRLPAKPSTAFGEEVRYYLQLTPRQLPSRYLYDPLGSALFDAICELPWYGVTRAENRLLAAHRGDVFARLPALTRIVELGPGDGRKMETLVQGTSTPLTTHLIDVSAVALGRAAHMLSDAPHVEVITHEASFEDGLDEIEPSASTLIAFLGSNIGNFDPPACDALLRRIRAALELGGGFLIGVDLVKPERDLVLAYDDPLGVSAAFNLNILARINRDLRADFDLRAFRHRAVWNAALSRMEMFVVSTRQQRVRIDAIDLDLTLDNNEVIWTESSYKYTPDALARLLHAAHFEPIEQWIDRDDAFALTLARAI